MDVAIYVVEYLSQTKDMPLVLGGDQDLCVHIYYDAYTNPLSMRVGQGSAA